MRRRQSEDRGFCCCTSWGVTVFALARRALERGRGAAAGIEGIIIVTRNREAEIGSV